MAMKRSGLLSLLLVICLAPFAIAAEPTTQPVGSIKGSITFPGEVPLSEMVVYLAPDDSQQISAPKETVKVSQKGAQFNPALVIVCVGQTVDFLNDEDRDIDARSSPAVHVHHHRNAVAWNNFTGHLNGDLGISGAHGNP